MSAGSLVVPMAVARVQESEGGLTWQGIVRSLPTDPASIFAMLLVVGVVGLVVWYGRKGGGTNGGGPTSAG